MPAGWSARGIRRSRVEELGLAGLGIRRRAGRATFACLSLWYWVVSACISATCTAPPPITAQPAAQADNFAMAVRIDIQAYSLRYPCKIA